MKEIITKFGTIFIETLEEHEEKDKIKFYDSIGKDMSYWSIAFFYEQEDPCEEVYNSFVRQLQQEEMIDYLLWDLLEVDYEEAGSFDYIKRSCVNNNTLNQYFLRDEQMLLTNDRINKIGNTFILLSK